MLCWFFQAPDQPVNRWAVNNLLNRANKQLTIDGDRLELNLRIIGDGNGFCIFWLSPLIELDVSKGVFKAFNIWQNLNQIILCLFGRFFLIVCQRNRDDWKRRKRLFLWNRRDFGRVKCKHRELVECVLEIKLTGIVLDEVPKVLAGSHWEIIIKLRQKEG